MSRLRQPLIGLAALAFIIAVVSSLTNNIFVGVEAEGFSRACTNLALLAIAIGWGGNDDG